MVINQAKIWVESEGQGTPMILIAGGPGLAHDYFHLYFSELSGKYRLTYFDAFGRGRSDRAASLGGLHFSESIGTAKEEAGVEGRAAAPSGRCRTASGSP